MPRSSVDLPQALGPTITVTWSSGTRTVELGDDRPLAVPQRDAVGDQPGRRVAEPAAGAEIGLVVQSGHADSPSGAAAGEQPEQERRPERAGDDAHGEVDVGQQVVGRRSRRRPRRSPPPAPAPSRVVRPPLSARAIGPARNETNAIGPAAATATAVSTTASSSSASVRRAVTPSPAAASSPSSVIRSDLRQPDHDRQQHQQETGEQPDRRPVGTADAAGEPAQHELRVVHVGAGEEVLDDRQQRGRDTDADQHQPEAGARPGDEPHDQRRCRPPRRSRPPTPQPPRWSKRDDREHRGGAGADADADDVGAGQRVAQRGLEDRAADAERDADQHAEHARAAACSP